MASTLPQAERLNVRKWVQALRLLGPTAAGGFNILTDAVINAATTVSGLITAINNAYATKRYSAEDEVNSRAAIEALQYLGPSTTPTFGYGILENSDVNSATTFAGLVTAIWTNAGIAVEERDSGQYEGNRQYFGNAFPNSTL